MKTFPLIALATLITAVCHAGELAPLRVSENHRYLATTEGQPFLWLGDTAWALFYKLNRDEIRTYLDDRQRKGFTVVQAVAYWYPHGEDGPGPHNAPNAYGHRPFQGDNDAPDTARPLVVTGGSPDDPNDYWDHADFIVRETRRRGLRLALLPCWGRAYVNAVMTKSRPTLTEATARSFGRFLGERYRGEPHVIWVIGGDANPTSGAGDRRAVYRAMAEGAGKNELIKTAARSAGGERMLIYFPDPTPARLNLPNRSWRATWIRPDSGEQTPARADPTSQFEPPADWPDALLSLVVRSRE